ncbi:MAG: branched-chain amino acid ABC transporter permease [Candidatus Bathyarchaeia archaeon]
MVGGALLGALYSLFAVGLNIQYGVTRILNLAYGELLMIGAYISYFFFDSYGINPLVTLVMSGLIASILGIIIQIVVFRRLIFLSKSGAELEFRSLLACFGLIYIIQNLLAQIFGTTPIGMPYLMEGVDILGERFKLNMVVAAIMSIIINAIMYVFIRFTRLGLAMRATAEEPAGAQLVGVNILKIHAASFSLGCLAAALAGSMLCMIYQNLNPYSGAQYTLIALIILVLGGRGSFLGSVIGGFIVGYTYYAFLRTIPSLAVPAVYILLILILVVRPKGILGR